MQQIKLYTKLSKNIHDMGRRNETNRLAHKKKVDNKKQKEQEAKNTLKEKRKAILKKLNDK